MDSHRVNLVDQLAEQWERMRSAVRHQVPREWTDRDPSATVFLHDDGRAGGQLMDRMPLRLTSGQPSNNHVRAAVCHGCSHRRCPAARVERNDEIVSALSWRNVTGTSSRSGTGRDTERFVLPLPCPGSHHPAATAAIESGTWQPINGTLNGWRVSVLVAGPRAPDTHAAEPGSLTHAIDRCRRCRTWTSVQWVS